MRIAKHVIITMLEERGLGDRASGAKERLPDVLDTDRDLGLLSEFGLSADDIKGLTEAEADGS